MKCRKLQWRMRSRFEQLLFDPKSPFAPRKCVRSAKVCWLRESVLAPFFRGAKNDCVAPLSRRDRFRRLHDSPEGDIRTAGGVNHRTAGLQTCKPGGRHTVRCFSLFKIVSPPGLKSSVNRLRWLTPPTVLVSPSRLRHRDTAQRGFDSIRAAKVYSVRTFAERKTTVWPWFHAK